jgi:23S rRNA pseudouridine2605 synthase
MTILKGSGKKSSSNTRKKGSKNISDSILKSSKRKTIKKIKQDKTKHHPSSEKEQIRLNRYIASTGLCSRRQADVYIKAGLITVNDKVVIELGTKIYPKDVVKYNGSKIRVEKKIYILLNKPKDYITTVEDPHASKTVLDLVRNACKERVYPVGRLDRTTTGVLLITNDGDLTKRLTHPKFNKLKVYQVTLNKGLKPVDLEKISKGVTLEDGFIKADAISYINPSDKKLVGIEIHSGRNRIVRRIFEHLNYRIVKLDRVYFAGLTKKGLARGQWRFLTEKEISMLKMSAYK